MLSAVRKFAGDGSLIDGLAIALERAIRLRKLRHEIKRLRRLLETVRGTSELLGERSVTAELKKLLGRIADSQVSVLVTDESGTGKEKGLVRMRPGRQGGSPRAR